MIKCPHCNAMFDETIKPLHLGDYVETNDKLSGYVIHQFSDIANEYQICIPLDDHAELRIYHRDKLRLK